MPGAAGDVEVPVAASFAAPQAALAADHQAPPFALAEDLLGTEGDVRLQHRPTAMTVTHRANL